MTQPNITLFDTHCHFDFDDFDNDRHQIWKQSQSVGVKSILIPGVSFEAISKQFAVVNSVEGGCGAIGCHPYWLPHRWRIDGVFSAESQRFKATLAEQATANHAVAIGECGLDATVALPLAIQIEILSAHIEVAIEMALPLIFHIRQTHHHLQALLKKFHLPEGGVVHAFSGSEAVAQFYDKQGVKLGVGGVVTYPRASKTRAAVSKAPLEQLVLETDAPDMPLNGYQGARNAPYHLRTIAETVAELKQLSLNEIAEATTANARQLFG